MWVAITSSAIEEIISAEWCGCTRPDRTERSARSAHLHWHSALPTALGFFSAENGHSDPGRCLDNMPGAGLAAVYLLSDRALLPAVIAHIAINLVIEPWLILSAVTRDWNPQHAKRFRPPQAPSGCSPKV
ncbi:hypothetical protein GS934_16590 [Rhodococcus hoagii]|nr:hypothetical protein [Prescottella equi]NKZ88150.1 hypothetical protein [Prescottella equi]